MWKLRWFPVASPSNRLSPTSPPLPPLSVGPRRAVMLPGISITSPLLRVNTTWFRMLPPTHTSSLACILVLLMNAMWRVFAMMGLTAIRPQASILSLNAEQTPRYLTIMTLKMCRLSIAGYLLQAKLQLIATVVIITRKVDLIVWSSTMSIPISRCLSLTPQPTPCKSPSGYNDLTDMGMVLRAMAPSR